MSHAGNWASAGRRDIVRPYSKIGFNCDIRTRIRHCRL